MRGRLSCKENGLGGRSGKGEGGSKGGEESRGYINPHWNKTVSEAVKLDEQGNDTSAGGEITNRSC